MKTACLIPMVLMAFLSGALDAGQIKYEAEDCILVGGAATVGKPAASGGQVVGGLAAAGATIEMSQVDGVLGGQSTLKLIYATTATDAEVSLEINGSYIADMAFSATGGWEEYTAEAVAAVTLLSGRTNTIRLTGGEDAVNIDYILIEPNVDPTAKYEAESGVVGGGAYVPNKPQASGGKVVGSLHKSGSYFQLSNIDGGAGGEAVLTLFYATTENSKLAVIVNGTFQTDVSFSSTGGWSYYTEQKSVTITLTAGSNVLRFEGGRKAVNIDYILVAPANVSLLPRAVEPLPQHDAWKVPLDATLSWQLNDTPDFAPTYNVSLGTDVDQLPVVSAEQTEMSYSIDPPIRQATVYYWRVDILNDQTTPKALYIGEPWFFMSDFDTLKLLEWPLDGSFSSGGKDYVADVSGFGNDGLLQGFPAGQGPQWPDGVKGQCLQIDGQGGMIVKEAVDNMNLEETDSWSVNFFLYLDEAVMDWTQVAAIGDEGNREFYVNHQNEVAFLYEGEYFLTSGVNPGIARWQMVTVTRDENALRMYINGREAAVLLLPPDPEDKIDEHVNILRYQNPATFSGRLDEFAVWDGALSAASIASLAEDLPLPADSSHNDAVGIEDLEMMAEDWLQDERLALPDALLADMEYAGPGDFTTYWLGYDTLPGSNTLAWVNDPCTGIDGNHVIQWQYDYGVGREIGCEYQLPGPGRDASQYDQLHIRVYKQAGSTGGTLWCRLLAEDNFIPADIWVMGEKWIAGGCDALPAGQWINWIIDLEELHTWDSPEHRIPGDRLRSVTGLAFGGYSESGGAGTLYIDDIVLVRSQDRCETVLQPAGDANGDCMVNMYDFAFLAADWLDNK